MNNDFFDFFGDMLNRDPSETMLQYELDRLYKADMCRYFEKLNEVKHAGNRVFRNSKGEHIVQAKTSHE